jgi:hypothetical protein
MTYIGYYNKLLIYYLCGAAIDLDVQYYRVFIVVIALFYPIMVVSTDLNPALSFIIRPYVSAT